MEIIGEFTTTVHRALKEIDKDYMKYPGLVICGTHAPRKREFNSLLERIQEARETRTPYLGICYGHQLAAIEYARNVLGIPDATSEELSDTGTFVVRKTRALNVGLREGESYWNNYEVYLPEWEKPDTFRTTQSHPEYQSRKDKPHKLLVDFIRLCKQG